MKAAAPAVQRLLHLKPDAGSFEGLEDLQEQEQMELIIEKKVDKGQILYTCLFSLLHSRSCALPALQDALSQSTSKEFECANNPNGVKNRIVSSM